MSMEFKDRLRYLLDREKITAYRVWKETQITKATIGNYLEGKTKPNKSNIAILASFFDVSENWLAYGEGRMDDFSTHKGNLIRTKRNENTYSTIGIGNNLSVAESETDYMYSHKEDEPFLITKSGMKYYQMGNGKYRMRVPFIPAKAYAKYVDEVRDADFLGQGFEEFDFVVDQIGHGRYYAFEIKGDSMDDDSKRSISNGDIVLARELSREYWKSKLRTEDFPNWIIVLDSTILCKQIISQDMQECNIVCHSLNPSPEYADFKLNLNDVRQLCNIVQRVSSSF